MSDKMNRDDGPGLQNPDGTPVDPVKVLAERTEYWVKKPKFDNGRENFVSLLKQDVLLEDRDDVKRAIQEALERLAA